MSGLRQFLADRLDGLAAALMRLADRLDPPAGWGIDPADLGPEIASRRYAPNETALAVLKDAARKLYAGGPR